MPSPSNVNRYLLPTDYPATRDELLKAAKERGAPVDVLASIEELPDRRYERQADLFDTPEADRTSGRDMGTQGAGGLGGQ